jgi:5-formaminoimidazole-4-carboxamide-1-(beta)-D-ribofuranosyl 5'-monophosphate synthetase
LRKIIGTLGSHCSLQVLKGAKDEGFKTLLISEKKRYHVYKRFGFIDHVILVDKFRDILKSDIQNRLNELDCIVIPHGTLISSLSSEEIESINVPFFGNKFILRWEADRNLKQKLMLESKLQIPKKLKSKMEINDLCIVKLHGAAGGKGYFLTSDQRGFEDGYKKLLNDKVVTDENELYIQEYVRGVPVFLHFFYSPISGDIEFMGVDRRYESDIDGISRIPSKHQLNVPIEPTYNVVGNIPLVLRESLLEGVYEMGENFVQASERLVPPGIPGPFCLEGVYTKDAQFIAFEFSARIVAGTNLYVSGSQYSAFLFQNGMSTGRRIALEIKKAINKRKLDTVLT